jgi:hypothetical protein
MLSLEEILKYETTILIAKDKILITTNTCDYEPYNCLRQVAKDN